MTRADAFRAEVGSRLKAKLNSLVSSHSCADAADRGVDTGREPNAWPGNGVWRWQAGPARAGLRSTPWRRGLGELALDVCGEGAVVAGSDHGLDDRQRLFLFSRSDAVHPGADEIQRNNIAEWLLGLPREARA